MQYVKYRNTIKKSIQDYHYYSLYYILSFDLYKGVEQLVKLLLIYQKAQKLLNLGFYIAYINNMTMSPLSKREYKSSINTTLLQLVSNICMTSTFDQDLVELLESQFVSNLVLSNNQHVKVGQLVNY